MNPTANSFKNPIDVAITVTIAIILCFGAINLTQLPVQLFLDVEQVRFDKQLKLHFDIEPEANHGSISLSAFGGELLLTVADDNPALDLKEAKPAECSGITKSRERLSSIERKGLTITIRLPH